MLYYITVSVYLIILLFTIIQLFIYSFRSKENRIYVNKNFLVLPLFMVLVSGIVSFSGLSKEQVEIYDTQTILINSVLSFSFLILASIIIYILVSWTIVFNDTYLMYNNFMKSNKKVTYNDIKYIDAFRPSSNGIIHIVTKDELFKINHNFIMGDVSSLTKLVSKYRKKK